MAETWTLSTPRTHSFEGDGELGDVTGGDGIDVGRTGPAISSGFITPVVSYVPRPKLKGASILLE